ncbi:MAG: UDP-N-acetylmuramoyl-L-alanine--D-glutamate ligase [gamma proteobacterium endosymbiont of Lamellibrachia anaximandri]|nr:UDP-N-acetylmuramoyl-L-alanine--D-glutamate ligase [gamma proteobacterium endosymbiont of Lamellibrachia anaximandri]MBL3535099.1 UDP-N-acetylmuramoyl-L-alanine--D-glutamate ligase [gamma proteobacterium endosymbiont of Lamellibrachia anaximandri]
MQVMAQQAGKILIVGLGKTGLSCARYLMRQGVPVAVTDSREQPPGLQDLTDEMPDVALFLGRFQPEVFLAAEQLVVSPGLSLQEPLIQEAQQRGVEIVGDIELFCRAAQAPIVAITGSNGKSTVTTLLGEMARAAGLKVAVGGNIGEPALDLLDEAVDLYILELSSFQLETTQSLKADVAVVLNISADHMDRYASLDEYAKTKATVYRDARVGLVNRDDSRVVSMSGAANAELGFTLEVPQKDDFGICENAEARWLCRGTTPLLPVSELKIPGLHNQANALAALALGVAVELPVQPMLVALRGFSGLSHRTQFVAEKGGVRWYNDSKGTNVGATIAALEGLHPQGGESRSVLIAGGDCKGADFSELAPVVERTARAVILIGRDAQVIEQVLSGRIVVESVDSLEAAVSRAAELAKPGDRVLLSPACASFDMFRNFEARGDAFIQAVEGLMS